MSRPAFRRVFRLELLETRELLTAGGPSAEAQYMLEGLNLARTNPAAAAQEFTSNLDANTVATLKYYNVDLNQIKSDLSSATPRQPLAWNDQLAQAATGQSQYQSDTATQTHYGANNSTPGQRIDATGYANRVSSGENAYAYAPSVTNAMQAFLIDWGNPGLGHRTNILQPNVPDSQIYREVGIGIVNTNKANFGPEVITQDFATNAKALPELVGVAFNDPTHQSRYTLGSGVGNVEVDATNLANGQKSTTMTWDNGGGYQISLPPGTYQVVAKVGDKVVRTQNVTLGNQNVKVDYNLSQPWQSPAVTVPTPAAKPVLALTPAAQFVVAAAAVVTPTPAPAPVVALTQSAAVATPDPDPAPAAPAQSVQKTISIPSVTAAITTTPAAAPAPAAVIATPTSSWFSSWYSWTARKAKN